MYGDMESMQADSDRQDEEWYASLPECDGCGCKITEGYYWEIGTDIYCTDCAAEIYRKEIKD